MANKRAYFAAIDFDLYEAVFAALAGARPGQMISLRKAVSDARKRLPATSNVTDQELVHLLVDVATTNRILVSSDSGSNAT